MKVGIIRCLQTEDMCPGTTDFKVIKEKKAAFKDIEEDIEIIGFEISNRKEVGRLNKNNWLYTLI